MSSSAPAALATVEQSLGEFEGNTASMDKIAAYARQSWAPASKHEMPGVLKKYAVDALVNAAYFVQRICGQLDALMTQEARELERLHLAMTGLESRLSASHRLAGEATLASMQLPRGYDNRGVAQREVGRAAPAMRARAPIDFRALDAVGTCLVPGQAASAVTLQTWMDPIGGGAAPATSAPPAHAGGTMRSSLPPAAAVAAVPPPPPAGAFGAPPPPPPPMDDYDLPPPPPPPEMAATTSASWLPPPPPPPPPI